MTMTGKPRIVYDEMKVEVPEGQIGAVRVERFMVEEHSLENLRLTIRDGRGCQPGEYTRMIRNGELWMSDTSAERRDHFEPAREIVNYGGPTLIGGLGLGMILRVALLTDDVDVIDVVEIDEDVIALVGPHYEAMAAENGKTLRIHHADMFAMKWPVGSSWSTVWFDVWGDLCTDDLEAMGKLRRSYGRRSRWCDCWGRHILLRQRAAEKNAPWNWR